jgi:hypothetical protein
MTFHEPLIVSPEIAEAARSTRSEAEARAERSERRQCELRRQRSVGRTHAQALERAAARREFLWRACAAWDEADRLDSLTAYCTALCGGDAPSGRQLAAEAIWS